jgi:UrcA family protein
MSTSRTQFHARAWASLSMLLGFGLVGVASASEAQPASITVSYRDLDLSHIKDAQRLYSRLELASATVCGNFDQSSLPMQVEWQRCYKQALAKAVVTVNAPLLQTVYTVRANRLAG